MEEILAPLIESLRSRLDGTPFVLYGHSMGALIAYEVAQRLRAEGRRAGRLFISGHRAPHVPYPRDPLHNLDDDALLRELQRLGGTPDDFFQHPDLVELLLPTIRSDLELCETYRHAPGPALDCDITVYGGEDDPDVMKEDLQAWQAHSSKDTQIHMFPGDHFFIHNEQGAMLARLAQDLQDLMEAQA